MSSIICRSVPPGSKLVITTAIGMAGCTRLT
jgi:hypothetical protein